MDNLIKAYEQQLQVLDNKLANTNNPIEWIRLEAQCIMLQDCINFAKQVNAQAKAKANKEGESNNSGNTNA